MLGILLHTALALILQSFQLRLQLIEDSDIIELSLILLAVCLKERFLIIII
jgi:hypothetical protein